jgi:hypothetical protein
MIVNCKTGEIVTSWEKYYETIHWENLIRSYIQSELSNLCYRCKTPITPSYFLHRTKKRLGNEKLTDIMPVCSNCLNFRPDKSKKKNERRELAPIGFNEKKLTQIDCDRFLSYPPKFRGYYISKYYAERAFKYKPSKQWINAQTKKACKWIRQQKKN